MFLDNESSSCKHRYDNRLEYLISARMKYEIIPFLHIEMFVITKVGGAKAIRADYLTEGGKDIGIVNALHW